MEIFRKRLVEMLKEKRIEQKSLAEAIGVSSKAVSAYARGKADPPLEKFKKIAEALNVSADYLLGLSDEPKPLKQDEKSENDPFAEEIGMIKRAYWHMSTRERRAVTQLVKELVGGIESYGAS